MIQCDKMIKNINSSALVMESHTKVLEIQLSVMEYFCILLGSGCMQMTWTIYHEHILCVYIAQC